jgi:3-hydroxyisobutyrate dehydrogenase
LKETALKETIVSENEKRIGFIGLGAMGQPMVRNLLQTGREVAVFDTRPEAMAPLAERGAVETRSPAEVARSSGSVHIIVRTEDQLRDVLSGSPDGGVLDNLAVGGIVLIHSTVAPAAITAAVSAAAVRSVEVLDAPVTGSVEGAEKGTLTFIVGGAPEVIDRSAGALDAMGARTIRVGAPGTAQIAKLINNMLAGINGVAVAEGLMLAQAAGLDQATALEVINAGTGRSYMSEDRDTVLATARHADLIGIGYKDLLLALQEAHQRELGLPITALATQLLGTYFAI